ncbi:DUF6119 family protein [Micromonospora saelicesensis]|uniref:Sporadically distributed protein, TIGR04141 family n=1 Tax=Micromonospora saelicesensis TaxID=285676 RepID=A0A1C5A865_9ACTN|nr:DUF6119 family protein [Micromonospora saelicesensis]SCF41422.1 sporadically distributed protein, TIGR04141 family [Micromonospora saelicesensis]
MPRTPAPSNQTTLYRLRREEGLSLSDYVQEKYLDRGFNPAEVQLIEVSSLLVYGAISKDRASWVEHAASLTGVSPEIGNTTSAGTLLVPYHEFIYALTWGMGFLILDPKYMDAGFGIRFAIRKADPRRVRSVTTNAIDALPRTAKTSILGGAALSAFRIEEIGEVLHRMVVAVPSDGLTCERPDKKNYITVRGADALNVPLGKSPDQLLSDISVIHNVVQSQPVVPGLEHLEGTRPLKNDHPAVAALEQKLSANLANQDGGRLAMSWPAEWEDDRGEGTKFKFSGFGQGFNETTEDLELEDVLEPLKTFPPDQQFACLKRGKIQALNNDGDVISRAIAANKWLTFETDHNSQRYVYSRGQWYNVGGAYISLLQDRVGRILENAWDVELPSWPQKWKKRKSSGEVYLGPAPEGDYNIHVAGSDSRFTCLDRKLLYTEQHPSGIESCDLLGPSLELIHVKRLDDSVSASHLFAQAQVSAEALCHQVDALERFSEQVQRQSADKRSIPSEFRPARVVLAFAGRDATVASLFTFSQVTLHRCAQRLNDLSIELLVTSIKDDRNLPPATSAMGH